MKVLVLVALLVGCAIATPYYGMGMYGGGYGMGGYGMGGYGMGGYGMGYGMYPYYGMGGMYGGYGMGGYGMGGYGMGYGMYPYYGMGGMYGGYGMGGYGMGGYGMGGYGMMARCLADSSGKAVRRKVKIEECTDYGTQMVPVRLTRPYMIVPVEWALKPKTNF